MKSLVHIFRDLVHHDAQTKMPLRSAERDNQPHYVPIAAQAHGQQHPRRNPTSPQSQHPASEPTRQEVLDYLGQLADQYHLPRKVVYGVANAESSFNPDLVSLNYKRDRHHNIVHDEHGNPVVKSKDHGLMQINSPRIGHDFVRDASGHRFRIEQDVIHDWKANARTGVAIIKHAHDVVTMSEGSSASPEDIALAIYSYYNHDHGWHKFLERDGHGMPKDEAVRNFYNKYRISPDR
jgi:hypothetical protein